MRTSARWILAAVIGLAVLGACALGGRSGTAVAARYQLHDRTARFFERANQPTQASPRKADSDRATPAQPPRAKETVKR